MSEVQLIRTFEKYDGSYKFAVVEVDGLQLEVECSAVLEDQKRIVGRILTDSIRTRQRDFIGFEVWRNGHSNLWHMGTQHPLLDVFAPKVGSDWGSFHRVPADTQAALWQIVDTLLLPQDPVSKLRREALNAKATVPEGTVPEKHAPFVRASLAYWQAMQSKALAEDDSATSFLAAEQQHKLVASAKQLGIAA